MSVAMYRIEACRLRQSTAATPRFVILKEIHFDDSLIVLYLKKSVIEVRFCKDAVGL